MPNSSTFRIGDMVETIKGAKFWGQIISFDTDEELPGCTVRAVDPGFEGTKHVYPLKQLGHRVTMPAFPRPLDEWNEDYGDVVWWTLAENGQWLGEPAYIGSPLDLGRTILATVDNQEMTCTVGGWPGYHTHWTPHPDFPPLPEAAMQQVPA